ALRSTAQGWRAVEPAPADLAQPQPKAPSTEPRAASSTKPTAPTAGPENPPPEPSEPRGPAGEFYEGRHMEDQLPPKIERVFDKLVVDKREALKAGFELMPRFVTEFLLAQARAKNAAMGLDDVRKRIAKFTVDADRKNAFIHELMMKGEAVLIALLDVE